MSVRAGKLRDKVRFQNRQEAADQYGNTRTQWENYANRYGFLREMPIPETFSVGVVQATGKAELTVRADSKVLALPDRARVLARGRWWNITGRFRRVGETASERGFMVFTLEAIS